MTTIKKFYNTETPEGGTGGGESIAALMARSGSKSEPGQTVAIPIVNTEINRNEPAKVEDASPAVPATEQPDTPAAAPETPTPTVEPQAVVETPIVEQQQPSTQNWQEVLKQQQPNEVLKELGFDEKVVGLVKDLDPKMLAFLNHWKTNGNVSEYLRELNTDYSKMPAEEVMRHQLRLEYPNASEKALNILYEEEVVNKYKLDPEQFSEEEVERGRTLLEAKVDKYRNDLVKRQEEFLLPKAPEPQQPSNEPTPEELQWQKEAQERADYINNSSYTKDIIANKVISIGDGDSKFNLPVEPTELQNLIFDSGKWESTLLKQIQTPQGLKSVPDEEKMFLVSAVAKYGKAIFTEYAKHLESVASKKHLEAIENASKPDTGVPAAAEPAPKTVAEAMARQGRASWFS